MHFMLLLKKEKQKQKDVYESKVTKGADFSTLSCFDNAFYHYNGLSTCSTCYAWLVHFPLLLVCKCLTRTCSHGDDTRPPHDISTIHTSIASGISTIKLLRKNRVNMSPMRSSWWSFYRLIHLGVSNCCLCLELSLQNHNPVTLVQTKLDRKQAEHKNILLRMAKKWSVRRRD